MGAWLFQNRARPLCEVRKVPSPFFSLPGLDAFVSVVIVLAGFQIFDPNSFLAERLSHAGDVALSSSQLVEHVKRDGIGAYWLGPVSGDEYTIDHEIEGIVDLMYLPNGADPSNHKSFALEVKTYDSQKTWNAHTHPIQASTNTQTMILNKEVSIRVNPTSMRGVIATYSDRPQILAIAYPKPQSLKSMIDNVKSLKLIK